MSTPQQRLTSNDAPDLSQFALPDDAPALAPPRPARSIVVPLPRPRAAAAPRPTLNPDLAAHVNDIISSLGQQGYDVRPGDTVRTPAQQAQKVAAGVSRTLHSKHLTGNAVDLVVYGANGQPDWDTNNPAWTAIGAEAKRRGLGWGGDFQHLYDPGHVQLAADTPPNLAQFALPDNAPDLSQFALSDASTAQPAPGVAVVRTGGNEPGAGEFWFVGDDGQKIRRVQSGDPLPTTILTGWQEGHDEDNRALVENFKLTGGAEPEQIEATLDRQTGQPLARTDARRVVPVADATVAPTVFQPGDPLADSGAGVRTARRVAQWANNTPDLPAGFDTGQPLKVRVPAGLNDEQTYAALSDAALAQLGPDALRAGKTYREQTGHNLAQPSVSFAELVQQGQAVPVHDERGHVVGFDVTVTPKRHLVDVANAINSEGSEGAQRVAGQFVQQAHDYNRAYDERAQPGVGKQVIGDSVVSGAQLAHNVTALAQGSILRGSGANLPGEDFDKWAAQNTREQQMLDDAQSSLPRSQSNTQQAIRTVGDLALKLPMYTLAGEGFPLVMMAEAAHRGPQEMFGEGVQGAAAGGAGRAAKGLLVGTEDAAGVLSAHPVLANLAARTAAGGVMSAQGATTAEGRTARGALTNFGAGAILPVGGREAAAPDEVTNRAPLGLHDEAGPAVEPSAQRGGATVGAHTDNLSEQSFNAQPGNVRVPKATPLPFEVDLKSPDGDLFTLNTKTGMLTRHADGQQAHIDEVVRQATPSQPARQQWQQQDFGLVTEHENQKGVAPGRVRVRDAQRGEHIIQRANGTGAGNQRAIPVRPPAQAETAAHPATTDFPVEQSTFARSPYSDMEAQEVLRYAVEDQRARLAQIARVTDATTRGVDPVSGLKVSPRRTAKLQAGMAELQAEAERAHALVAESFGGAAAETFNARAREGLPATFQYDPRKSQRGAVNVSELAAGLKQLASKDTLLDLANAPRTIVASVDLSAPLRQGAIQTLTEPRAALHAMKDQLRAFLSGHNYDEIVHSIAAHPDADLARKSGLYFATREAAAPLARRVPRALGQREEAFMSRLAGSLPLVKQSERAYTIYLDRLRMEVFHKYARELRAAGATDPQEFQSIAHWLNLATGRGSIGDWGKDGGAILNAAFFAPRYTASRFQVLSPTTYMAMSPLARRIALRKMAQYGATVGTTLALAHLAGAEVNFTDPSSPDWLKIKLGNTRYDLAAGNQQNLRFLYRMGDAFKRAAQGRETEAKRRPVRVLTDYLRSKLAPVPGAVVNMVAGQTATGEPTTTRQETLKLVTPLMLQDLWSAYQQEGLPGALKTTPGLLGVGVQTYASQAHPQTEAERQMSGYISDKLPATTRTAEQKAKSDLTRTLKQDVRAGKDVSAQLDKAVDAGTLTPRDVADIERAADETPLQSGFKRLTLQQAEKVYRAMNPDERKQVNDIYEDKKASGEQ